MSMKERLTQLADEVKRAGLAGKSMQAKMSELIDKHDLSSHEIDRVSEIANRDVQLALYKTATDKRFKFELINPAPLKAAAKKAAQASLVTSSTTAQKVASVIQEQGGDPFAVPYRAREITLMSQPMNMKTAAGMKVAEIRNTILELDRVYQETQLLLSAGQGQRLKIAGEAEKTYGKVVQSAIDMLIGGVTLPSLYTAVSASVGGNGATDEQRRSADDLMMMVIKGVKERGIPNHRLGFRHRGNIELLDNLSAENLLNLCKRSTGRIHEHDIPTSLSKVAEHFEMMKDDSDPQLANSGQVAQPYLDEKYVDNMSGGKPLVINGENEFVIGITDLIGDQSRMLRCHSANEYIGLKLKQIEHTLRSLKAAQKVAEEKEAAVPQVSGFGKVVGALSHPATTNAVNIASIAAPIVGDMLRRKDNDKQAGIEDMYQAGMNVMNAHSLAKSLLPSDPTPEQQMNKRLKSANVKLEQKQAFLPALVEGASLAANVMGGISAAKSLAGSSTPAQPKVPTAPKQTQLV